MGGGSRYFGDTAVLRSTKAAEATSKGYDPAKVGTFIHTADIKSGKAVARVHERLDPYKMKDGRRESRDSAEHPNSMPVAVCLDVTGSMHDTPKRIFSSIYPLVNSIVKNGALEHPQVLFAAVGDASCDKAPFQVGQFESNAASEEQISDFYLEGGGGGNAFESYDLYMYFLARCTSCDAFEKRGEKGYAFLIQDEPVPPYAPKQHVQNVFGAEIQGNIPFADIVKEAQEKWNIFILRPIHLHYGKDPATTQQWEKYFPGKVIPLQSVDGICEQIAMIIAAEEGADLDSIEDSLVADGSSRELVLAAKAAVKGKGGIVKAKVDGELAVSGEKTDRL